MKNMSFIEALEYINNGNHVTYMTRNNWPFKLHFCPLSQNLMIEAEESNLISIPYVISTFDFDYEWEIVNP